LRCHICLQHFWMPQSEQDGTGVQQRNENRPGEHVPPPLQTQSLYSKPSPLERARTGQYRHPTSHSGITEQQDEPRRHGYPRHHCGIRLSIRPATQDTCEWRPRIRYNLPLAASDDPYYSPYVFTTQSLSRILLQRMVLTACVDMTRMCSKQPINFDANGDHNRHNTDQERLHDQPTRPLNPHHHIKDYR
jgi:hypothetical protein